MNEHEHCPDCAAEGNPFEAEPAPRPLRLRVTHIDDGGDGYYDYLDGAYGDLVGYGVLHGDVVIIAEMDCHDGESQILLKIGEYEVLDD